MNVDHLVSKAMRWMDWTPCFGQQSELLHPLSVLQSPIAIHHVAKDLNRGARSYC